MGLGMRIQSYKQMRRLAVAAIFFWLAALCVAVVFGQPVSKISGPTETLPGELTVLESKGSTGDNLLWIPPKNLTVVYSGCDALDMSVFFATTRQGTYEFLLVTSDDSGIAFARHSVTVGAATPAPEPEPDPPTPAPEPDPDPIPEPGRWGPLKQMSRSNADRINDPATRAALKQAINSEVVAIKQLCERGQCPTLPAAKRRIVGAIERELLRADNRNSQWAQQWRVPNNGLLDQQVPRDLPDYLAAVQAIADGL